jgi:hypothetical protein
MLIVYYVLLVWLKVVLGISVSFLWLWYLRDRGVAGALAYLNYAAILVIWALPWGAFIWSQADLYQGHCGLRQGVRDCGVVEFLWERLRWLRVGFVLDLSLLMGAFLIIFSARAASSEDSRAFGRKGPRAAAP